MRGIGVHVCEGCGGVFDTIGDYLDHIGPCWAEEVTANFHAEHGFLDAGQADPRSGDDT